MSAPKTVAAYFASLDEPHRSTLKKVRADIMSVAPFLEESISYGIPTFKHGPGHGVVSIAAFKAHCSLFPMSNAAAAALGLKVSGKSTVQFPPDKPPSAALVRRIVKYRLGEQAAVREQRAAKKAGKKAAAKKAAKKIGKKKGRS
ncbi:MAG: iron chaperone [Hyphomonadaceae bacterium]